LLSLLASAGARRRNGDIQEEKDAETSYKADTLNELREGFSSGGEQPYSLQEAVEAYEMIRAKFWETNSHTGAQAL